MGGCSQPASASIPTALLFITHKKFARFSTFICFKSLAFAASTIPSLCLLYFFSFSPAFPPPSRRCGRASYPRHVLGDVHRTTHTRPHQVIILRFRRKRLLLPKCRLSALRPNFVRAANPRQAHRRQALGLH